MRTPKQIDPEELKWQVNELLLLIDNEQLTYNRKILMFKNLFLKLKKNRFDKSRAPKLFSYLTDDVARKYNNEYGKYGYNISTQARRIADVELVEEFLAAVKNKDYGFMM